MSETPQDEEPMEIEVQGGMASSQDKNEGVLLTLSLKWSQSDQLQKPKPRLEKLLQTWFNKRENKMDCSVESIRKDGSALIKVKPSLALSDLWELNGKTLTSKDGKTVTVLSISLAPPNLDSQKPDDESMSNSSSVPGPQADKKQSDPGRKDIDPQGKNSPEEHKKPSEDCLVSVGHYWYVNHIYKEEIQSILKRNKVKIKTNVSVEFEADQEDGSPQKALVEFTELVQDSLSESCGTVFPLKFVDPDQWSDAMRVVQKNKSKLLLTLSCEEVTVCGPSQSQDAFSAALNAMQKRNPSLREHKPALQDTSPKINMTIKDPLVDAGLTMNESHWKLMNTAYAEELTKIKEKFGVTFRESNLSQDKIDVKASYLGPGGNASLESHAVRALLHLHQKTATSPLRLTQPVCATGLSGSVDKSSIGHWSEETSGGPPFNGESTHQYTKAPEREGASAGDIEDDKCPICLSTFTNKTQLKCKHKFCNDCLQEAKKHGGPICPVCKDVFGLIEGDQPDGQMTWTTYPSPLPGFQNCGHIVITYDIPGGVQTGRHPNPGQHYYGTRRVAYLPDNKEGKEVLQLLKKAFGQKLIFTVGASRTTGAENQVTWNDIHHKTSPSGGPQRFGYPDPNYLKRVKEELKDKGIK
ncbi:E3 ubiquitin-protein ligase DTX3L-like isoform X2 [Melanotaenia boesemani]|uniref:E3 ubiquitin-protein ligase DTX3L-like isoform X2 n=1 Tax=Melanotaenia boesemani TaxID=1250792 RepID=UPI001C03CD32|nr:E3 ubiquitin-protein ligase DTX3L-like isoform X2 [Melanotaenia boesemani]